MSLKVVLDTIDAVNAKDPNVEVENGKQIPKELLYSKRMTDMLHEYVDNSSDELQIAARAQHIKRWAIPRSDFPMDRKGYLKWRTNLKLMHGKLVAELMEQQGYGQPEIEEVVDLITKKKLKTDEQSKTLEDVVCLVFLKYYFKPFAHKYPKNKLIDIVKKTWVKMTANGHSAALQLPFEEKELALIKEALS